MVWEFYLWIVVLYGLCRVHAGLVYVLDFGKYGIVIQFNTPMNDVLVVLITTARSWRAQLHCWWTLLTNLFPCEIYHLFLGIISFGSALVSSFPTEYGSFIYLSDNWSRWHCKLVSYTCWLVWSKVASKIIQGSGC